MHCFNPSKPCLVLFLLCAAMVVSSSAQTFSVLGSVGSQDPGTPGYGPLVQGFDGNLYGVTSCNPELCTGGTIFQLTTSGVINTLHNFTGPDGYSPNGGLIVAPTGLLYGTTQGNHRGADVTGGVFYITTAGHFVNLYRFCKQANCFDGDTPQAGLFLTTSGFWGTTAGGGANSDGTVFNISPGGVFKSVFSFNGTDGLVPSASLAQGINNNLYGTTQAGGTNSQGTIFEMTSGGTLTTIHNFESYEGELPFAQLVPGPGGIFYGTAILGGLSKNLCVQTGCGSVFSVSGGGHTFILLHRFVGTDGFQPLNLVLASDGNLYGVTYVGGPANNFAGGAGTIFQIKPDGAFTTLYNFCSQSTCQDGAQPLGLMQATDGNFYGITNSSDDGFSGIAFKLSMGLPPFVTTMPIAGSTGRKVIILGTDLSGATAVTFNGTAATFTIVSPTEITTTVPAGSTTGNVEVVTPGGTLVSKVPFRAN